MLSAEPRGLFVVPQGLPLSLWISVRPRGWAGSLGGLGSVPGGQSAASCVPSSKTQPPAPTLHPRRRLAGSVCQASGAAITYLPDTRRFHSFIYYYVPPFLCRRQPHVNFTPFSNALGYTTNNSRKQICIDTLRQSSQVAAQRFNCRAPRLWAFAAEFLHMTLKMSLRVYHGLIVEPQFHTFLLSFVRSHEPEMDTRLYKEEMISSG